MSGESQACPTMRRVIFTDSILLHYFVIIFPSIPIFAFITSPFIISFSIMVGILIISTGIIYWWYSRVCRAFRFGQEVKARILKTFSQPAPPTYGFEYIFDAYGTKNIHSSFLVDCKRTRKIKKGVMITILLDPKDKNRSFPKEVYLD